MGDLTKNFSRHEFACHHCGKIVVHPCLVTMLQKIRDEVDGPIIINSGFRCLVHNRAIGSSDTSRHVKGMAADIRAETIPPGALHDIILSACNEGFLSELGGLGRYDTFIHVDVDYAPEGRLRRW